MRKGLVWYRFNDLRTLDHQPLQAAHEICDEVCHIFIFDPTDLSKNEFGDLNICSKRFLFLLECIFELNNKLIKEGNSLLMFIGTTMHVLASILSFISCTHLFTHHDIGYNEQQLLYSLDNYCKQSKCQLSIHYDYGQLIPHSLLPFSPDQLGSFSSFKKAVDKYQLIHHKDVVSMSLCQHVLSWKPSMISLTELSLWLEENYQDISLFSFSSSLLSSSIEELEKIRSITYLWNELMTRNHLLEEIVDDTHFTLIHLHRHNLQSSSVAKIQPGEIAGHQYLQYYCLGEGRGEGRGEGEEEAHVTHYAQTRNELFGTTFSSKLSLYLATGCLTARQIHHQLLKLMEEKASSSNSAVIKDNIDLFILHLLWRDYMQLYSLKAGKYLFSSWNQLNKYYFSKNPSIQSKLRSRFRFPSSDQNTEIISEIELLERWEAWKTGQTGYPLIDAAMKELNQTGYISNRMRQIVASFLIHDLEIPWYWGARYFESQLLDYDVASNYGNWQYIAGVYCFQSPHLPLIVQQEVKGTEEQGIPTITSITNDEDEEERLLSKLLSLLEKHRKYFHVIKQSILYDPDACYIQHWLASNLQRVKSSSALTVSAIAASEVTSTVLLPTIEEWLDLRNDRLSEYYQYLPRIIPFLKNPAILSSLEEEVAMDWSVLKNMIVTGKVAQVKMTTKRKQTTSSTNSQQVNERKEDAADDNNNNGIENISSSLSTSLKWNGHGFIPGLIEKIN
jgi:DASH family cryptochrome